MIVGRFGVALAFRAPIIKAGGDDLAVSTDWTPAAGDVKLSKDGGNVANITTLPSAVGGTGSALWSWPLSATEMEALEALVQVVDAATKAVKDQAFRITTLPPGALYTGKASAGGASTITIATGLNIKAGQLLEIHGGTGAGQGLIVNAYVSGTGVVTMENPWGTQPDSTSLYTVWPGPIAPVTTPPSVNVTQNAGTAITATSGVQEVKVQSIANNAITTASINNDAITAAKIATNAIDADALAADAVDKIIDDAIEGSTTLRQLMRGFASALLGKAAGMGTTTGTFRDLADTKNRISATQDADGNRTAVTLDLT